MSRKHHWGLIWTTIIVVGTLIVTGFLFAQQHNANNLKTVTVGIVGNDKGTQAIWQQVAKTAKEKYGITVQTRVFTDYNQLNKAVKEGNIDLNAFQHYAFLKDWNKKNHGDLVAIGETIISPIRIYSKKYHSLDELPYNAVVAIPNDPSNESRALFVLKNAGLIKLDKKAGSLATIADVKGSSKGIKIKELAADQTARSLSDVDAAIVNNDFVKPAGLGPKQTIYIEPVNQDSHQWINIIVARKQDQNKRVYQDVVKAYQTTAVRKLYKHYYGNTDIPVWKKGKENQ